MVESLTRLLGCQARPWLQSIGMESFAKQLPAVMAEIAAIGFAGFETALPVIPLDDPERFTTWQAEANGLQLAAAHTGGAWWQPEAKDSLPDLMRKASQLPNVGCHRLMVSIGHGIVDLDDATIAVVGAVLGELATELGKSGVEVALHNHAHELHDNGRILRLILDAASDSGLKLGADLGWVAHAGVDPVRFIEEFGNHLGCLHVRDVAGSGESAGFIEVNQGSMDWTRVVAALDHVDYHGWLVAESEFNDLWRGSSDPATTARLQFDGLGTVLANGTA